MIEYTVTVGDDEKHITLTRHGSAWEAVSGDGHTRVDVVSISGNEAVLIIGGRRRVVPFAVVGDEIHFDYAGEIITAEVTAGARKTRRRQKEHSMAAPMPALVTKILVEPGAIVTRGTPLLVLEAMKMEHQISAPYDGVVAEIRCKAGEMVQPPEDLIVIEKKDPAE
jgi:biotin carboxyl carrier protein